MRGILLLLITIVAARHHKPPHVPPTTHHPTPQHTPAPTRNLTEEEYELLIYEYLGREYKNEAQFDYKLAETLRGKAKAAQLKTAQNEELFSQQMYADAEHLEKVMNKTG